MKKRKKIFKPDLTIPSEYILVNNNYRKLHGIPMIRRKHIAKEQDRAWERFINRWCDYQPGYIMTADELRSLLL